MEKIKEYWRGFAGLTILSALLIAFALHIMADDIPTYWGRVLAYFSYFTEYSNILVMLWFMNKSFLNKRIKFLNKDSVRGALTLYIVVAGIVFFLVLKSTWNQQGIDLVKSYILHAFAPIAFVLDWLVFGEKGKYINKNIPLWIIFPIVYLFWALFIGNIIGVYPYPFLDLNEITFIQFLNNLVYLIIAFLGLAFIIVNLDKLLSKILKSKNKEGQLLDLN